MKCPRCDGAGLVNRHSLAQLAICEYCQGGYVSPSVAQVLQACLTDERRAIILRALQAWQASANLAAEIQFLADEWRDVAGFSVGRSGLLQGAADKSACTAESLEFWLGSLGFNVKGGQ